VTLPTFLGVGASKSGTTSLARWLGEHPDVFVSPEKELRFFTMHWDLGPDWYAEHFTEAGSRPSGEFTPDYMHDATAVERMAATVPDAQLIVCLREPVARLLSHYWHNRLRGSERRPVRQAVEQQPDYVGRGDYLPQLLRLEQHYDRTRIHAVLFDDLRDQPAEAFAATCRFLDVDDTVRPELLGTAFNTASAFRSKALRRQMLRWGAFRRAPALSRRLDALNRRQVRYVAPDEDDLRWLRERCAYDVSALEAWLDRPLPASWTSPS
jgi:hypothetical protein